MKRVLTKIHFSLLTVTIINFIFKFFLGFSLLYSLEFGLKLAVIATGLILFVFNLKPFKGISIYFSIYALSVIYVGFALLVKNLFFGFIAAVLIMPIFPKEVKYQKEDIIIYDDSVGFMGMCCSYKITEKRLLIFEKNYGSFQNYGVVDFETCQLTKKGNSVILIFIGDIYDEQSNEFVIGKKEIVLNGI